MRKIKRRKKKTEEKEFLLENFTTLLFLVSKYLKDQEIPDGWGLAHVKKESKDELIKFLSKHGAYRIKKGKKIWRSK